MTGIEVVQVSAVHVRMLMIRNVRVQRAVRHQHEAEADCPAEDEALQWTHGGAQSTRNSHGGKLHVSFRSMCWPPPPCSARAHRSQNCWLDARGAELRTEPGAVRKSARTSRQRTDRGTFRYCALLWRRTRSRATRRARYCIIAHCNRADCAVHVARTNGTPFARPQARAYRT